MGKERRLSNILKSDGKAFIVAMDHGTFSAPAGLENMGEIIELIKEGGADGVLLNPGAAKKYADQMIGLGLIMRTDLPPTLMSKDAHESRKTFGVEQALSLAADAVIVNGGTGTGVEEITLDAIAATVNECEPWNMPVIGEMVPGGFDSPKELKNVTNLAANARIASEIGVDMIKMPYCEGFADVVKHSFVPILVLGGAKTDNDVDFVCSIKDAIDAGASGVAIGRNVWGHENPKLMAKALAEVIHGNASKMDIEKILR
ncbi:deoxyribose-phosphate aldolase [Clostridia bacterium]|nr:deoxyribose-phosphate aldolase [Clostridia bacterium]